MERLRTLATTALEQELEAIQGKIEAARTSCETHTLRQLGLRPVQPVHNSTQVQLLGACLALNAGAEVDRMSSSGTTALHCALDGSAAMVTQPLPLWIAWTSVMLKETGLEGCKPARAPSLAHLPNVEPHELRCWLT